MKTHIAEIAKQIRKSYKDIGLTSKDVSVKSSSYSMGRSISVKAKSPEAIKRLEELKDIADSYKVIRRDYYTGDILNGGNTYIHCEIDFRVQNKLEEMIFSIMEEAREEATSKPDGYAEIESLGFSIQNDNGHWEIFDTEGIRNHYNAFDWGSLVSWANRVSLQLGRHPVFES